MRSNRSLWLWASALVLGAPLAHAVHLPEGNLPVVRHWQVPAAPPLAGLEGWRLQGLFSQGEGRGWALLDTGGALPLRVEVGGELGNGVRLLALDEQGVWLARGAAQSYLRLGSAPMASASDELAARAVAAPEAPSAQCQQYLDDGVPAEELVTLGLCAG